MCMVSVGNLIIENEMIQQLMANPSLDLIHKQVLMTLYALDAQKSLADHKTVLPIYLSMNWDECDKILGVLESAGTITRNHESILLNYPLNIDATESSCGCMA
ncbi:MAG: hypothetical protein NTY51_10865 [Deltaproteobacteria bacterium]|nr:hypothetical protein [Deltaproteobacteria bacterium]